MNFKIWQTGIERKKEWQEGQTDGRKERRTEEKTGKSNSGFRDLTGQTA